MPAMRSLHGWWVETHPTPEAGAVRFARLIRLIRPRLLF